MACFCGDLLDQLVLVGSKTQRNGPVPEREPKRNRSYRIALLKQIREKAAVENCRKAAKECTSNEDNSPHWLRMDGCPAPVHGLEMTAWCG